MTISYTGDVANASDFGCFNKILFKWKGSVYKLIYKELLAYLLLYMIINVIYRNVVVPNSQCSSEDDVTSCKYVSVHYLYKKYVFDLALPCL